MLHHNAIEKEMKKVCEDYMKGEKKMEFTTNDNYTIKEGKMIYYTGDMANTEGSFIIAKIQPCEFYKFKVILQEDRGENRKFTLTPASFNSGVGRRFKPMELVQKERLEAKKRFHNMINKSKEQSQ